MKSDSTHTVNKVLQIIGLRTKTTLKTMAFSSMHFIVFVFSHQLKIFRTVVVSFMIKMMNYFMFFQITTDDLFDDQAMFWNVIVFGGVRMIWNPDHNITPRFIFPILPKVVIFSHLLYGVFKSCLTHLFDSFGFVFPPSRTGFEKSLFVPNSSSIDTSRHICYYKVRTW